MNKLDELLVGKEMKLSEDQLRTYISEIIPLVEEESKLKSNLKKYQIKFLRRKDIVSCQNKELNHQFFVCGRYSHDIPSNPKFVFPSKFYGNEDLLKGVIAHEIVHNIQYNNFTYLLNFLFDDPSVSLGDSYSLNELDQRQLASDLLIEGDADLLSHDLSKKHFPDRKRSLSDEQLNNFLEENGLKEEYLAKKYCYKAGEAILREKFNGDRNLINPLYLLEPQELIDIFGLGGIKI